VSNPSARDIASSQELLWAQSTLALCYKPDDVEYMMEAAVRVCLSGILIDRDGITEGVIVSGQTAALARALRETTDDFDA